MNSTCFTKKLTESLTRPLAACTLALAITAPADAALLAYDPIDGYDTGTSLAGQAALGSGFTGSWQALGTGVGPGGFMDVASGGLTYSKGLDLQVSGSQHISQGNINSYLRTELLNPINSGTVYVSMLGRAPVASSTSGTWLPLLTVNQENVAQSQYNLNRLDADGAVHLIVYKFDLGVVDDVSDDKLTYYLDPTLGVGENNAVFTDYDLSSDGSWTGGTGGFLLHLVGRGGHDLDWDELRVGTTWDSVTPAVPEPSSLALIGLGGMCVLRRRRNA